MTKAQTPIEIAVEKAGGQSALARLVGKSQGHVWSWLKRKEVPAEMVVSIEAATGIPRQQLRPDLYANMIDAPDTVGAGQ